MHSDQRQPGCNVIFAALTEPRSTTSTSVLFGVRRSSGDAKLFFTTPAIMLLPSGLKSEGLQWPRDTMLAPACNRKVRDTGGVPKLRLPDLLISQLCNERGLRRHCSIAPLRRRRIPVIAPPRKELL